MQGKTHLAGGLLAGAAIAYSTGQPLGPGIALAGLAALIPDWIQINIPGGNQVAKGIFGHRGISHWAITVLAVWWGVKSIYPSMAAYIALGMATHLALDLFAGGMAIFWPWPGRMKLSDLKSGSLSDTLIGAAALALAAIIIVRIIVGG